jgi:hypothetical protein
MNIEALMEFGLNVLRASRLDARPEDLAVTGRLLLVESLRRRGVTPEATDAFMADSELSSAATALWARNGFPTVEMGHKFAAALLVSNITPDLLEMLKPPWSSFMITVPDNLLFLADEETKQPVPVRRVLVFQIDGKLGSWSYIAYGSTSITIWRYGVPASLLLPPTGEDDPVTAMEDGFAMQDVDHKAQVLVGRLIIATCAAMTMHGMAQPTGPGHARHQAARKVGEETPAVPTVFKLGKPIEVDFRDRVREFAAGEREGHRLEARHMVCGHFKRQHYGKGNAQVKTIWREPHWRGPGDAPVLVRTHVMVGG